jgi:hypothetical protein
MQQAYRLMAAIIARISDLIFKKTDMFTRLFRSHINIQLLVLLITALLLWSDGFIKVQVTSAGTDLNPLFNLVFGWSISIPWMANIIAFILLLCSAFLLNNILTSEGITNRNSYFPAFLFILLYSYCPGLLLLHPTIPATLILIFSLRMIFKARHQDKSYQEIFTSALLLSLTSLFNIYYIVFIPLIFISLIIYRSSSWREWVIAFIGILTPLFYTAFYHFWNDNLLNTAHLYEKFFTGLSVYKFSLRQPILIYIIWGLISFSVVPAFIKFFSTVSEKIIILRRILIIIVWLFLLSMSILPFASQDVVLDCSPILLPASIFIVSWLQSGKAIFFRELMLWLLICGIIIGKFLL